MNTRPDKNEYYLRIAAAVAERGTCLRRKFGAVIVNNDQIISTGYAGAPRGAKNCIEIGYCPREAANIPKGERYELCRSVHAEMNAIIHASRAAMNGGTMYLAGMDANSMDFIDGAEPCRLCKRAIINAGIVYVIVRTKEAKWKKFVVETWVLEENPDYSLPENTSGY